MTANQINYAKIVEDMRHNTVMEGVEKRKASAQQISAEASSSQAATRRAELRETQRSHGVQEALSYWAQGRQLSEIERHNLQTEAIQGITAMEQARKAHTETSLMPAYLDVSQRQAAASELSAQAAYLRGKAAQQQAAAGFISAAAQTEQARIAGINAATRQAELQESQRSHLRQEALGFGELQVQARIQSERNTETKRHNVSSEGISQQQVDIAKAKVGSETARNYSTAFRDVMTGIQSGTKIVSGFVGGLS